MTISTAANITASIMQDKKTHVPAGETNEDVAPVNVSCSQEDEVALRSFPVIGASGHCTSNVGLGNTDGNASDKTNGNSWSFFTSFLFCCLGSQGRGGY
ncbi:unnamed protein product [Symbiodinium sp. CCMP2592]|nr:unnamed protein product [Symbiodinium sp. CCMP2592]